MEIFLVAINAMLTTGFMRPPLRCPIAIANVAILRPAVSEMFRTILNWLLGQFNVDPQTRKTNIVVAKNSAPTQTQNLRFRSAGVSGIFTDRSASRRLKCRSYSVLNFNTIILLLYKTVLFVDWLGGYLSFYFCYGYHFLRLTSFLGEKLTYFLHGLRKRCLFNKSLSDESVWLGVFCFPNCYELI